MKKVRLSSISYIASNIFIYIMSLAGLIVSLFAFNMDINLFMSISILILILISERFYFLVKDDEKDEKFSEIKKSIDINLHNSFDIQAVSFDQALHLLTESAESATRVRNTYLPNRDGFFPSVIEEDAVLDVYSQFLGRSGTQWIDVVSIGALEDFRHTKIKSPKDGFKGEHIIHVSKKNSAAINFIILSFHDRKTEVIFGWGADTSLVRTTNEVVVDIFEDYFEKLTSDSYNSAAPVSYVETSPKKRFTSTKFVDKVGSWATLTVEENQGSGVKSVTSYGYLKIIVEKERLEIAGVAQWAVAEHQARAENVFFHEKVSYSGDSIFLEFDGPKAKGICVYNFKRTPLDDEDRISGYILYEDGRKESLFGIRMDEESKTAIDQAGIRYAFDTDKKTKEIEKLENELIRIGQVTSTETSNS